MWRAGLSALKIATNGNQISPFLKFRMNSYYYYLSHMYSVLRMYIYTYSKLLILFTCLNRIDLGSCLITIIHLVKAFSSKPAGQSNK